MASKRDSLIASAEKSLQKGKVDAALKDYLKVLEEVPNDINILNKVGDLFVRLNRNEESLPYFTRIAEHYSKEGFFLKAIAIYKKINKLDPSRLDVYERLAELYTKQGLAMEAKSQYQVLADYYLKQENFLGVIGIYQKMLQTEPANMQLHVKLADLFTQAKRIPDALKEYLEVARMLRERNAQPEAIQVYGKALKLAPDNVEILKVLVGLLTESGQVEEARNHLKKALETTPRSVPLFVLAAETAFAANDMAEARSYGAKAQAVDADNEEVVQLVVKIQLRSRRADLAYQAALPLAEQFVRRGEAKKAVSLLIPIAKAAPENEDLLKKIVDVYTAAGDEKGGVPFRAHLAELWRKQGKNAEAVEALRLCARYAPDVPDYRAQLSQLEALIAPPPAPPKPQPQQAPPPVASPPVAAAPVSVARPARPAAPPAAPKPVQTAPDEFEFDLSEDDERSQANKPAPPSAAPQSPAGAGAARPAWGRPQGPPPVSVSVPPLQPRGVTGQYPAAGSHGITYGPVSSFPMPPPQGPSPLQGGGLDLEIGVPQAYEVAEALSAAEEVDDAVEIVEEAGAGLEVADEVVEEVEEVGEAAEVPEIEELEPLPDVVVTPPPPMPAFTPPPPAFLPQPVYGGPLPGMVPGFQPQTQPQVAYVPPPVSFPPATFTAQYKSQAIPVLSHLSAVPGLAPPPLPGFPVPPFSKPPADTVVEEALVEAEIFRKYGLLDKAIDQIKGLVSQFPQHTRLREKLFELYLENGSKSAAKGEAEELKKIYALDGREDRIRGLAALLGEPLPAPPQPPVAEAAPEPPPVPQEPEFEEEPVTAEFKPLTVAPVEVARELVEEVVEEVPDVAAAPAASGEEGARLPAVPSEAPAGTDVSGPLPAVEALPVVEEGAEIEAAVQPEVPAAILEAPAPSPVEAISAAPSAALPPPVAAEQVPLPLAAADLLPPRSSGSFPAVKQKLGPEDLAAALTAKSPSGKQPAVKKPVVEIDPLAALTKQLQGAPKTLREKSAMSQAMKPIDLSELDALAGMGKPVKKPVVATKPSDIQIPLPEIKPVVPRRTEPQQPVADLLSGLVAPSHHVAEPVALPPPIEVAPVLPLPQPSLPPQAAELIPEIPVVAPVVDPSPEELGEVDFCLEQGMVVDAAERLQSLEGRFPGHPEVVSRRARLEGSRGPAEEAKKALSEIFSEDLEMVLDAELGKALTDEMARGPVGPEVPPQAAPAEHPVAVDESGLFSDEQEFFNFADELQSEMKQESIVEKAAGPKQEVSLEEIFREFKKGVEQQLSPEDHETHYNLGIAYKEMGLTDEAIGEFQIASKDPLHAVECCSMLGLCFLEKGLPQLAIKWYRKGLESQGIREGDRLGLQYDLASVYATLGDRDSAYKTFLEIYGADASFRDVSERVKELEAEVS